MNRAPKTVLSLALFKDQAHDKDESFGKSHPLILTS